MITIIEIILLYSDIVLIMFPIITAFMLCFSSAYALTTDEILLLKQHGVSERTIQLMIQSEMEGRKQAESSIQIKDEKSSITYSTGKPASTPLTQEEKLKMVRDWGMLKKP